MPLYVANMSSPLIREKRQSEVVKGSRNWKERGRKEEGEVSLSEMSILGIQHHTRPHSLLLLYCSIERPPFLPRLQASLYHLPHGTYSLFSLIVHQWARGLKVDY